MPSIGDPRGRRNVMACRLQQCPHDSGGFRQLSFANDESLLVSGVIGVVPACAAAVWGCT